MYDDCHMALKWNSFSHIFHHYDLLNIVFNNCSLLSKKIQKIKQTPVLFVTGVCSAVNTRLAKQVGAIGIIEKEAICNKYQQKLQEFF